MGDGCAREGEEGSLIIAISMLVVQRLLSLINEIADPFVGHCWRLREAVTFTLTEKKLSRFLFVLRCVDVTLSNGHTIFKTFCFSSEFFLSSQTVRMRRSCMFWV
jgi:ABC-type uncharacterized transport system involved in gliding motility auxiliary subunit